MLLQGLFDDQKTWCRCMKSSAVLNDDQKAAESVWSYVTQRRGAVPVWGSGGLFLLLPPEEYEVIPPRNYYCCLRNFSVLVVGYSGDCRTLVQQPRTIVRV